MAREVPQPKPVRLKDIAGKAGVTAATVSLALSGHPRIPAPTRDRIRRIARRMGYRPDPRLSALAEYRRTLGKRPGGFAKIALLHASGPGEEWATGPNKLALKEGVRRRAEELGYEIEEFAAGTDPVQHRRLSRQLYHRGIEGILIGPAPWQEDPPEIHLDWEHFAAVALMTESPSYRHHAAIPDYFRNALRIFRELQRRDERREGVYLWRFFDRRTQGAAHAASRWFHPELGTVLHAIPVGVGEQEDVRAFGAWFRKYRPRVVITDMSDEVALMLRTLGLEVPEDVGLIAVDNRQSARWTGIDIQPARIGESGVDLLHSLLVSNVRGLPEFPRRLAHPGRWAAGRSWRDGSLPAALTE